MCRFVFLRLEEHFDYDSIEATDYRHIILFYFNNASYIILLYKCITKKESLIGTPYKNGRRLTFPQTSAVSSARAGLTSLFGMGRGEHRLYNHPNNGFDIWNKTYKRN